LEEANQPLRRDFVVFGNRTRHVIYFNNKNLLVESVKEIINANVVNAIHCDFPTLACVQHALRQEFPATKFRHCKNFVTDITNTNKQLEIVNAEHNCAHKAAQENAKQILRDYYFPNMSKLASEVVANCKVCNKAKHVRHPKRQELGSTPIPSYVGEMLHIDIFSTDKKIFLACIDKFSKFAIVQPLSSRVTVDVRAPVLQLVNFYHKTTTIYCDNEASFNSETITCLLKNQYSIDVKWKDSTVPWQK